MQNGRCQQQRLHNFKLHETTATPSLPYTLPTMPPPPPLRALAAKQSGRRPHNTDTLACSVRKYRRGFKSPQSLQSSFLTHSAKSPRRRRRAEHPPPPHRSLLAMPISVGGVTVRRHLRLAGIGVFQRRPLDMWADTTKVDHTLLAASTMEESVNNECRYLN